MFRLLAITILLLQCFSTVAQNLVPNPSFEQLKLCPTFSNMNLKDDHIEKFCAEWENVGVNRILASGGGGQYYHECTNDAYTGIPRNVFGFQYAHTGKAYASVIFLGTYAYNSTHYYTVRLINPLKKGKKYTLRMYVSLSDSSNSGINNLGMLLSTQKLKMPDTRQFNIPKMPNRAHLYSSDIITDKDNWVKIDGTIIADSNYQYLTIGNFFDFDKTSNSNTTNHWDIIHYYIDDISVEESVKYITAVDKVVCKGTPTKVVAMGADDHYYWSLNKTDTFSISQEIVLSPTSSSYIYLVHTNGIDSAFIKVVEPPMQIVPDSIELCEEYSIHINAFQPNANSYFLNDKPMLSEFSIDSPGKYKLKTVVGNCSRIDEIQAYACETNLFYSKCIYSQQ